MNEIKVFLVEDEMVIRRGIKNSIDWEKEGYIFCGEASDGELAYPMIIKEKPDILITDIRMPFMDGLELCKLVKKELPNIKILILSGYDEFDYAKEAIRLGVTEYLLKPISSGKLLEALNGVSESIRREKEDKDLVRKYMEEMRENTEHEKQKFFEQMIAGNLSMADALETGKKYEMNLSAGMYNLLLFRFTLGEENRKSGELLGEAEYAIEKLTERLEYVFEFQRGVEGWAFLLMADNEEQMSERVKELSKDEAVIAMVDANLQRETILPSEKAFAYKMKLEAIKHQGVASGQLVQKWSRDKMADESSDSGRQIQRYIRLTKLVPDLLAIVDEGRIALRPAVELSYLGKLEQQDLVAAIGLSLATPSHAQAIKLRTFSKEGKLSPAVIESIMCEEKPNQKEKINIKYAEARKYIPSSVPYEQAGAYILKALEYYHRQLERQRGDAR